MKIYFTKQHIPLIGDGSKTQARRPIKDNVQILHDGIPLRSCGMAILQKHKIGDILQVWEPEADQYSGYDIEITNIRVEWLQDISEEDCFAEGVKTITAYLWKNGEATYYKADNESLSTAKLAFEIGIWNKLSYKPPYDWNSNPLVLVYEFKRIGE